MASITSGAGDGCQLGLPFHVVSPPEGEQPAFLHRTTAFQNGESGRCQVL